MHTLFSRKHMVMFLFLTSLNELFKCWQIDTTFCCLVFSIFILWYYVHFSYCGILNIWVTERTTFTDILKNVGEWKWSPIGHISCLQDDRWRVSLAGDRTTGGKDHSADQPISILSRDEVDIFWKDTILAESSTGSADLETTCRVFCPTARQNSRRQVWIESFPSLMVSFIWRIRLRPIVLYYMV